MAFPILKVSSPIAYQANVEANKEVQKAVADAIWHNANDMVSYRMYSSTLHAEIAKYQYGARKLEKPMCEVQYHEVDQVVHRGRGGEKMMAKK